MSEARPYKKTPEKVSEEVNELRSEVRDIKKDAGTEKTIIREETIPVPKTESKSEPEPEPEPKKKEDENKETLDDVKRDDRYRASSGS